MAIMAAPGRSIKTRSKFQCGRRIGGKPEGISPTVFMPKSFNPQNTVNAIETTTKINGTALIKKLVEPIRLCTD